MQCRYVLKDHSRSDKGIPRAFGNFERRFSRGFAARTRHPVTAVISSIYPKGSMWLYGIYLGPKVIIWEPFWALSIYYIATWTLWVLRPQNPWSKHFRLKPLADSRNLTLRVHVPNSWVPSKGIYRGCIGVYNIRVYGV